jgi:hypothetical protein
MNIELSAKEHIKTLQRHIKANILADVGGRVSVHLLNTLIVFTQRRSSLSRTSLVPFSLCSLRRQGNRSSLLLRASLSTVPPPSVQRTTCCRYLLAPPSSFLSVSCYLPNQRDGLKWPQIIAIINIVDFYLDRPDVLKQLAAADPKNPALEGYIYEAMRKAIPAVRVEIC